MAPCICWHCGADLERPGPVARGDMALIAESGARGGAGRVHLRPIEREILQALLRTQPLRGVVIADRIGTSDRAIQVHVCRLNRRFEAAGLARPIAGAPFYYLV